ncbi:MAG: CBS domain-containing protein [Myxococcales bacterium]|nr:CBS domain-containing protein [Myxococcales bacterium]
MKTTIRDLMTSAVTTLAPEDDLMKADAIMQRGRFRHLPVVRGGELVGLITHRDLLRAQIEALGNDTSEACTTLVALPAGERMRTNVLTTTPDASPAVAARQMLQNRVGCLPVVENGKLVGIVSEADFVKWALDAMAEA